MARRVFPQRLPAETTLKRAVSLKTSSCCSWRLTLKSTSDYRVTRRASGAACALGALPGPLCRSCARLFPARHQEFSSLGVCPDSDATHRGVLSHLQSTFFSPWLLLFEEKRIDRPARISGAVRTHVLVRGVDRYGAIGGDACADGCVGRSVHRHLQHHGGRRYSLHEECDHRGLWVERLARTGRHRSRQARKGARQTVLTAHMSSASSACTTCSITRPEEPAALVSTGRPAISICTRIPEAPRSSFVLVSRIKVSPTSLHAAKLSL